MPNSIGVPAVARQVASDRQRHAGDAAFARRVGRLADLAVVGGDAGGVDQHAAFFGRLGLVLAHCVGGDTDHVEAVDEVECSPNLGLEFQWCESLL
jgi:hypothetical protein